MRSSIVLIRVAVAPRMMIDTYHHDVFVSEIHATVKMVNMCLGMGIHVLLMVKTNVLLHFVNLDIQILQTINVISMYVNVIYRLVKEQEVLIVQSMVVKNAQNATTDINGTETSYVVGQRIVISLTLFKTN